MVKAMDYYHSVNTRWACPRRFEPCSSRQLFLPFFIGTIFFVCTSVFTLIVNIVIELYNTALWYLSFLRIKFNSLYVQYLQCCFNYDMSKLCSWCRFLYIAVIALKKCLILYHTSIILIIKL